MYPNLPDVLTVEADGPIRIVTLNNPDMLNAMIDPLHEGLTDLWTHISRDHDVRAVVLTGSGRAFSAGGNIPGFIESVENPTKRRADLRTARAFIDQLLTCHVPVIAAVNGPAVGLGCSLAVACDLVFMAEGSYLADTHVNVGLVAGDGGVVTWPLMMSLLKVKEYLFTGDRIPAETAVQLGLANRVYPGDTLLDEAKAFAHRLAQLPAQALQETKRALNLHLQQASLLVLPFALAAESESFTTQDVKDNIEKFKARS